MQQTEKKNKWLKVNINKRRFSGKPPGKSKAKQKVEH